MPALLTEQIYVTNDVLQSRTFQIPRQKHTSQYLFYRTFSSGCFEVSIFIEASADYRSDAEYASQTLFKLFSFSSLFLLYTDPKVFSNGIKFILKGSERADVIVDCCKK